MVNAGLIPVLLIIVNGIVFYRGFNSSFVFERHVLSVDRILLFKEYRRIITSGFLHVGWVHLIFNMLSLYAFSGALVTFIGEARFLLIYAFSLVGGNLLSLFIHRNDGSYRAAGASGAVCGIMFASIALFPDIGVGFFGIPFSIPGWLYGFVYIIYCIYGIRSRWGNIGHDAHFGGAIIGLLTALLLYPEALRENYPTILLILVPSLIFIFLLVKKPQMLLLNNTSGKSSDYYSIDHKYNAAKRDRQKELDRLLDKIHKSGMQSLTEKERQQLKEYSKERR